MATNLLRETLTSGAVAVGAWLTIPSGVTAEAFGDAGFDYICVDMQHGLVDYADCLVMLQSIHAGGSTSAARVTENQPGYIGRALDAGVQAVIVPMVNSADECRAAVAACRYAPDGSRSYGPTRAAAIHGPEYFERANTEVMCIPMIETATAVRNLDAILEVSAVEAIYVGPNDLAVSMGFGPNSNDSEFLAALDDIVAACHRHDVIPGIHCTQTTVNDRLERGFRMVTVTSDLLSLRAGMDADLAAARSTAVTESDSIY